jgi:hypothetical protein
MYESRQAMRAYPEAVASGADGNQDRLPLAGAAAMAGLGNVASPSLLFLGKGGLGAERHGFAALHFECAGGAHSQAKAGAVAQLVSDDTCLPVHQLDRALSAGCNTQATAVAKFLVDSDDGPGDSFHFL